MKHPIDWFDRLKRQAEERLSYRGQALLAAEIMPHAAVGAFAPWASTVVVGLTGKPFEGGVQAHEVAAEAARRILLLLGEDGFDRNLDDVSCVLQDIQNLVGAARWIVDAERAKAEKNAHKRKDKS